MIKDKNKEAIKIIEENKLTNVYSPEDQIKMELEKDLKKLKTESEKSQDELEPINEKEES
mgnify:CR=1 FL=1|jgi:hypothetical protein|tara:strand:+ start:1915 stop:2094 length:180 start_codon:yes stop_codon:yes gene_type:complete